jgi:hypothetical protein
LLFFLKTPLQYIFFSRRNIRINGGGSHKRPESNNARGKGKTGDQLTGLNYHAVPEIAGSHDEELLLVVARVVPVVVLTPRSAALAFAAAHLAAASAGATAAPAW